MRTMFSIRPYEAEDAGAVAELMDAVWGHDPEMRAIYDFHRDWQAVPTSLIRQTLVALSEERVIGVGTIFESTFSPAMLFLNIHVLPEWQRQGVGSLLYDELIALGDGRAHVVKITRKDAAGVSFLEKRGYSPVIETLRGVLDPSLPDVKEWMGKRPTESQGFVVVSVDAPDCKATPLEVAMMHFQVYKQYHAWSPPAEPSEERVLAWFMGEDVVPGTSLCAYLDGELVGAANLIKTPFATDGPEAYMVWVGVLESAVADAVESTAILIRRLLEIAGEAGLRVRFEADGSYVPHRKILDAAPAVEVDRDFMAMSDGKRG